MHALPLRTLVFVSRLSHGQSHITSITCHKQERSFFGWFQRLKNKSAERVNPATQAYKPAAQAKKPAEQAQRMVDPQRVVSYEDMLEVIKQPGKVIIDVRNPDEVSSTGKIPSSINIPLHNVDDVLTTMSDEDFERRFQRQKPRSSDELIFYCKSGKRSSEALDKALRLGYSNSKTYLGSWNDWSSRRQN